MENIEELNDNIISGEHIEPDENDIKYSTLMDHSLALEEKINELEDKNADLMNKYLRALADYQNLQRISSERIAGSKLESKLDTIKRILPIVDSFERAIEADEVNDGVMLIYKQLMSFLEENNVSEIESSEGGIFNDSIEEAIGAVPTEDKSLKGFIAYVQQKGYIHSSGKILRYSKVGVYV